MLYVIPYFEYKYLYLWGYPLQTWVVLLLVGVTGFFLVIYWEAKRKNLNILAVWIIFLLDIYLAEAFAKFFYILSRLFLHHDLKWYTLLFTCSIGRIFFGSLVGTLVATWLGVIIAKKTKDLYKYLDIVLTGEIAALFFYRVGNFLWHEHIGKVTTFPLGMEYLGQIRHEVSLYETLSMFVLFCIIWGIRKKVTADGALSVFILLWISASHFLTDFFRVSDLPSSNFRLLNGLTLNQLAYLGVMLFMLGILIKLIKKDYYGRTSKNKSITSK